MSSDANHEHEWTGKIIGEEHRWRLVRLLGEGRTGRVFRADGLVEGRTAAAKIYFDPLARGEGFRRRFAALVGRLDDLVHPNLPGVLDHHIPPVATLRREVPDVHCYVVSELLAGVSLAQHLKGSQVLALSDAMLVATSLLAALAHAHGHGLAHGELRPSKVFLCDGWREGAGGVKLVGLELDRTPGVSLESIIAQEEHAWPSVSLYIAPERFSGGPAGVSADIYSLGMVLYRALSGRFPYETVADGHRIPVEDALFNGPIRLATAAPDLPDGLCQVIDRALRKDPEARFPAALAMARALGPYAASPPPSPDVAARVSPARPEPSPALPPLASPAGHSAGPPSPRAALGLPNPAPVANPSSQEDPGVTVLLPAEAVLSEREPERRPPPSDPQEEEAARVTMVFLNTDDPGGRGSSVHPAHTPPGPSVAQDSGGERWRGSSWNEDDKTPLTGPSFDTPPCNTAGDMVGAEVLDQETVEESRGKEWDDGVVDEIEDDPKHPTFILTVDDLLEDNG